MSAARVEFLEHTADVGFEIEADSLPELFQSAAASMFELLLADGPERREGAQGDLVTRTIQLRAREPALLLAAWLRELLFCYDTEGLGPVGSEFHGLSQQELEATVTFASLSGAPVREIKAVTYHQLFLRQEDHGWRARVIFDV